MYIILAYDIIDSPYRLKPLDERKRVAKERIFGDKEDPEKFQNVKKGIKAYQSLIYDSRRSQIEIDKTKIGSLQKQLEREDEPKAMEQILKTIEFIRKDQDKLEKEVAIEEEMMEIRGGNKLTFVENWKRNLLNSIQK